MAHSPLGEELRSMTKGTVLLDEPMSCHTSFRVGGKAEILVIPASVEDVEATLDVACRRGIGYFVLGGGTNLLVRDGGIKGITMKIGRDLAGITELEDGFSVGAGVPLAQVVRRARALELGGLEFAVGIPGSIGGAVTMNAGAFSGCMAQILRSAVAVRPGGERRRFSVEELGMKYRESMFRHTDWICTEVQLGLASKPRQEIQRLSRLYLQKRRASQPWTFPSAGSVFKNPPGNLAGRLIETAGGKGLQRGEAQVSPVHANFIVNKGGARAEDVLSLIDEVRTLVHRVHGVKMDLEIEIVGEA